MSFDSVSRLIQQLYGPPQPVQTAQPLPVTAPVQMPVAHAAAVKADDGLQLQTQAPRLRPLQVVLAGQAQGLVSEPGVRPATLNALNSMGGTSWVGQSDANGGRELAIWLPEHFDAAKPVEVMFYFHGHNGTIGSSLSDPVKGLSETLKTMAKDRNLVLVMPQGPAKAKDYIWMNPRNKESLPALQQQVWERLGQLAPGVTAERIDKVRLTGHSAGGLALFNGLSADTPGLRADRIDFLDASYGNWASGAQQRLNAQRLNVDLRVLYLPGTDTETDALRLKGKAGVMLIRGQGGHGSVPRRYLDT